MGDDSDAVRMARLEEQMKTMYKQHDALVDNIKLLSGDVKDLVATMNRGRGAFGFAMLIAGSLGAAAVSFINYILKALP